MLAIKITIFHYCTVLFEIVTEFLRVTSRYLVTTGHIVMYIAIQLAHSPCLLHSSFPPRLQVTVLGCLRPRLSKPDLESAMGSQIPESQRLEFLQLSCTLAASPGRRGPARSCQAAAAAASPASHGPGLPWKE